MDKFEQALINEIATRLSGFYDLENAIGNYYWVWEGRIILGPYKDPSTARNGLSNNIGPIRMQMPMPQNFVHVDAREWRPLIEKDPRLELVEFIRVRKENT